MIIFFSDMLKDITIIFTIVSVITGCAGWDTADKILFTTSVGLQTIDTMQTITAIKAGTEEAPTPVGTMFGSHPTSSQLVGYSLITTSMKYIIADWLSPEHRKVFLGALIIGGMFTVTHNHVIVGIRIDL